MSGVQDEIALELGKVSDEAHEPNSLKLKCQLSHHGPPQTTKEKYRLASTSSAQKAITDDRQLPWMKAWQRVEVGVICVVIAVVWGLLSLPVIFYHIPPVSSSNNIFILLAAGKITLYLVSRCQTIYACILLRALYIVYNVHVYIYCKR